MSDDLAKRLQKRISYGLLEAYDNLGCFCKDCVAEYLANEVLDEIDEIVEKAWKYDDLCD